MTGEKPQIINLPNTEAKEFQISDLAVAIAQRELIEESFFSTPAGDVPDDYLPSVEKRAIFIQRVYIDGEEPSYENLSPAINLIEISQAIAPERFEDSEYASRFEASYREYVQGLLGIYNKINDDPNYHLNFGKKLAEAKSFSEEKGVSVEDVFRNEDLYLEFVRSLINIPKLMSSIGVKYSEEILIETMKLTLKFDHSQKSSTEFDESMFDDPDVLEQIKETSKQSKVKALGLYVQRYFSH